MSDRSKIEWTDASWNPVRARDKATGKIGWYCEHASDGCRFCYAESFNRRLGTGLPFKPGHRDDVEIFLDRKTLGEPLHWRRPRKIFAGSMTDLGGDWLSWDDLDEIMAIAGLCWQHRFIFLTKRSKALCDYLLHAGTPDRIDKRMNEIASRIARPARAARSASLSCASGQPK